MNSSKLLLGPKLRFQRCPLGKCLSRDQITFHIIGRLLGLSGQNFLMCDAMLVCADGTGSIVVGVDSRNATVNFP